MVAVLEVAQMGLLERLFGGKASQERTQEHTYTPGQTEPKEYTRLWVMIYKAYVDAEDPNTVALVGFDDEHALASALDAVGSRLNGVVREQRTFAARNPVAIIEYPSSLLAKEGWGKVVSDAEKLHSEGASDISVMGISMSAARKLHDIFGKMSCVHLGVVTNT